MTISVTKPSINLREKLNELDQPQGIKGTELMRADTVAEARTAIGAGRKNLIINGGFDVWQRGTSFSSDGYTADRWTAALSGGTATSSRQLFTNGQTDVPGNPTYYLNTNCTSGNNNCSIATQHIEDVRIGAGQSVTVSFWAKGTNPGGGHFNWQLWQRFGTGGSSTVNDGDTTLTVTSTWTRYTHTFNLGSMSGKTIGTSSFLDLMIRQPADDMSAAAWSVDIANVQLELGSVATDFEHRSYGEELALCQRYYERKFYTNGSMEIAHKYSSTRAVTNISYSHKRTNPTVTMPTATTTSSITNGVGLLTTVGSWASSTGTIQIEYSSSTSVRVNFLNWPSNGAAGDSTWVYFVASSGDAYVEIDAEL